MTDTYSSAPTSATPSALRRSAVVLATIFAIAAPIAQALVPLGMSASEFADDGNETLRAAGYAFSIWSLIYFGLVVYALYQAFDRTGSALLARLGWPSVIAIAGCGAWILASAYDQKLATMMIIVTSATTLIAALLGTATAPATPNEQRFAVLPLALLAGWLTTASAINILTVFTAWSVIANDRDAVIASSIALAAVALVALIVIQRTKLRAYAAPIAWGLVAVYVAEREHRPLVALAAAALAGMLAAYALWVARKSPRP